jgi:hypothetical protein
VDAPFGAAAAAPANSRPIPAVDVMKMRTIDDFPLDLDGSEMARRRGRLVKLTATFLGEHRNLL